MLTSSPAYCHHSSFVVVKAGEFGPKKPSKYMVLVRQSMASMELATRTTRSMAGITHRRTDIAHSHAIPLADSHKPLRPKHMIADIDVSDVSDPESD